MRQTILLSVLALLSVSAAGAPRHWDKEPTDFHGIRWDAPWAEARSHLPGLRKDLSIVPGIDNYKTDLMVGTVKTRISVTYRNGRLLQINMNFRRQDWQLMKPVFLERFGPPMKHWTEDGEPVMGWTGQIVGIELGRGTDSDTGAAFMVLKEDEALYRANLAARTAAKTREDADKRAAKQKQRHAVNDF